MNASRAQVTQGGKEFQVNFLVVGAQRCGTTSLARSLGCHPDVCMAPVKEVHFFDTDERRCGRWDSPGTVARYRAFFPNYTGQPAVGEATPIYMYLPEAPERIHQYNPEMKLIVVLREPGARAVSQWQHERGLQREWLPLRLALSLEPFRLWRDRARRGGRSSIRRHSYADRGRYAEQVQRLLKWFHREQILIVRSEDLRAHHGEVLESAWRFLGLSLPTEMPSSPNENASTRTVDPHGHARRRVARACAASTRDLEKLLGWDLTEWRAVATGGTEERERPC